MILLASVSKVSFCCFDLIMIRLYWLFMYLINSRSIALRFLIATAIRLDILLRLLGLRVIAVLGYAKIFWWLCNI